MRENYRSSWNSMHSVDMIRNSISGMNYIRSRLSEDIAILRFLIAQ